MVLIETYWNVKVNTGIPCGSPLHVLIETYWNVKEDVAENIENAEKSINRNILECKGANRI